MAYRVELEKSTGIIKTTYIGHVTLEDKQAAIAEVAKIRSGDIRSLKVMIDIRETTLTVIPKENRDLFILALLRAPDLLQAQVAVVHGKEEYPISLIACGAYMAGFHISQFACDQEAQAWLNG